MLYTFVSGYRRRLFPIETLIPPETWIYSGLLLGLLLWLLFYGPEHDVEVSTYYSLSSTKLTRIEATSARMLV